MVLFERFIVKAHWPTLRARRCFTSCRWSSCGTAATHHRRLMVRASIVPAQAWTTSRAPAFRLRRLVRTTLRVPGFCFRWSAHGSVRRAQTLRARPRAWTSQARWARAGWARAGWARAGWAALTLSGLERRTSCGSFA